MFGKLMEMLRSMRWLSALGILALLGGVHHFAMPLRTEPLCWRECPNEKSAQNEISSALHALSTQQFGELRRRFNLENKQEDDAFLRMGNTFAIVEPKFSSAFDGWVAHDPNAFVPRLARGSHLFARAWLARGTSYGFQTTGSQFAEMDRLLKLAQEDVTWALRSAPSSRAAHLLQVRLARFPLAHDLTQQTIHEHATTAAEACRDTSNEACDFYPDIWLEIANNLQPKWGGSTQSLEALRWRSQRSSLSAYNIKIVHSHIDCLLRLVNPSQDRYPEQLRANIAELDEIIGTGPASTLCLQHRIDDIGALRQQLSATNSATEVTQLRDREWDDLQRYLAMVPTDVEYSLKRAEFYQGKANLQEKIALLQTAARLNPGSSEILEAKAQIAERAFNYDAALVFIKESLRIRPYALRTQLWHAQLIARDVTQKRAAAKLLRNLSKRLARFNYDDIWLVASTQWELQDFKGLLRTTQDCLHRASWSWCEAMRAAALVAENRLDEARALLDEGGTDERRWTISRVARANLLLKQNQVEMALKQFELAAVEYLKDPQRYSVWRDAALAQGHCDAIRAATGQLQWCGTSALCSADRISSLAVLENPENAQKCPNLQMFLRL